MVDSVLVQVRHLFRQPPAQVFDHWLAEHQAGRWMFATPQGRMHHLQLELAPNHQFRVTEQIHGRTWVHTGEYHQIHKPHLLLFSCTTSGTQPGRGEPDMVQLQFQSHPLGCELVLSHQTSGQWAPFRQQLIEGWTHIFAGLMAELNDREYQPGEILN
ncbi:SRPBCC family protein [Rheinheimera tilapiae]|jgi:uncharacterized protein YndB with AHSA1/START domain|uniref:SRPBCC domain-containing protein n=1 Tax=Rheinheimera tilapiae TaxID=875043 RepID=A0ABV6BHI2_9GAMM